MSKDSVLEEIEDKEAYAARVAPYFAPNGLVYVFSQIQRHKWKKKRIIDVGKWQKKMGNVDVFYSIQQYKVHTEKFENDHQEPYFAPLYFDFDASEKKGQTIEQAKDDTRKLCEKLSNIIDPPKEALRIWYSGSRGFHVTLDGRILGVTDCNYLHLLYKNIAFYYADTYGLDTLDRAVYSIKRQWRLPNSKRSKRIEINGEEADQHKVELSLHELSVLSIDEIRELAVNPRKPLVDNRVSLTHTEKGREFVKDFIRSLEQERTLEASAPKNSPISLPEGHKDLPVCMQAIVGYEFAFYKRFASSLTMATFFRDIGVPKDVAKDKMYEWVKGIPWDKDKESDRLSNARAHLHSVYDEKRYVFGCAFVRAAGGTHYTGKEVSIPCEYSKCPYLVGDPGEIDEDGMCNITLFDTIKPEYFGKTCECFAHVEGFMDRSYSVPMRLSMSCPYVPNDPETFCDECSDCGMPMVADNNKGEMDVSLYKTVVLREKHYLAFVGISDKQKKGIIRSLSAIEKKCVRWNYTETKTGTLRQLYLRSPIGPSHATTNNNISWDDEKSKEITRQPAFVVNAPGSNFFVDRNLDIKIICVPVTSSRDQSIHLAIKKAEDGYSELERFSMSPELHEQLKVFQVVPGQTVEEKIMERVEYISNNITHIRKRPQMNLAYDLVFHSIPYIKLGEHEDPERGMLQLLVIGDPGQGKSLIGTRLMKHYQLGKYTDGSAAKRTGLLYTIEMRRDARILIWGDLPREDRRLVMIDEFHQINKEDIEQMTSMRSNGRVDVSAAVTASTNARVRMIFVANPRGDGKLDKYSWGVEAISSIFERSQDVRRLDASLLCRSGDVNLKHINVLNVFNASDVYSSSSCRNLILWAWTRMPEHIKWTDGAVKHLFKLSTILAKLFECDISIAEGADMRYRLGRIAQAVAAMVYSTDDEGENLWVKEEHVQFANDYFQQLMTETGEMNLDEYALNWQSRNAITEDQEKMLEHFFINQTAIASIFKPFCRTILTLKVFTKKNISTLLGVDPDDFVKMWSRLCLENMIIPTHNMYECSPKFKKWLRDRLRKVDLSFSPKSELPED